MKLKTILLAIVACIFWGSAFPSAKFVFEFFEPIFLSGIRFTLAGLLLLPFLLAKKVAIKDAIKRNWKFMSLFALIQTFLQYGLFYMGLSKISAATASIIIGAGPMFTMILAHFVMSGDKITLRKVLSMLLGLSGVVFIAVTKGGEQATGNIFYYGLGLLLLSNIIGSYTNIMVAKHKEPISPILLTAFANFSGGILLTIVGCMVETLPSTAPPLEIYAGVVWLALIPAVAFSIWYTLLQRPEVKVSDLNMYKFVIPVSGSILSWIFLANEKPNIYAIIGIIVITVSLLSYPRKG